MTKATFDIEMVDDVAWLQVDIAANDNFFRGEYALGVNKITLIPSDTSAATFTLLRD
jgi:hypothetical protein